MFRDKGQIYKFGPFRLIPLERQLLRDDELIPLTPKSFDLLVVLVENSGHLVEKSQLMEQIWPDSFVEEANLSVKMSELRRALGEGPNEHRYIETVPRRGYRFVADVKEIGGGIAGVEENIDANAADPRVEEVVEPSVHLSVEPPTRSPFRRRAFFTVGILAIVPVCIWLYAGGIFQRTQTRPINIQSVAVLPLEDRSGDPLKYYIADGIVNALIADLAKISALRVVSRSSVMRYEGTRKEPAEIGRELNVDAVLAGSFTRTDETLQVSVKLISAADGRSLWSQSYERHPPDVLALQEQMRQDIVSQIKISLTPQEQVRFESARPVNPEAYDHYLRGRFFAQRQTSSDNDNAIAELEQAVAIDNSFAAGFAELSQLYVWKLFLFAPKDDRAWAQKAYIASEKALALDPGLAVAYLARGRLLWTPANHFPHEKAIQEYKRALALDPHLDEARNQLALVYCHIGAFDEALEQSQKAIETNPGNNLAQYRRGQTLNFMGKYEEALAVLHSLPPDVNPALVGHQTAWALFNMGRIDESEALLTQLLADHPEDTGGVFTSMQALLAASKGDEARTEEKIRLAIEKGKGFGHFHHTAYQIASAYAIMNRSEESIKWLANASDDGFPCYPLFERDQNLNNLRKYPKFEELMARLKKQWEGYKTAL